MKVFSYKADIDTVLTPMDSIRYYKYLCKGIIHVDGSPYRSGEGICRRTQLQLYQVRWCNNAEEAGRKYHKAISCIHWPCRMGYRRVGKSTIFPTPLLQIGDSMDSPQFGPKEYHGKKVTLRWGLAQSENYISAWLMKQFSPAAVAELMKRMGIRSYIPPYFSIFLGTADLSLEEMVGAYGTFSNKGVYTKPYYVTRIEDRNGNVLATFTPTIDEVLTEEQAYLMTNLLEGVVKTGSGQRLRARYQLMNSIGGKTGTTQEHSDGWFMGITPNIVAGVWSGWEDRDIHFETLTEGQGANMALPVFAEFLKRVYADSLFMHMAEDKFEAPPGFSMELDCEKVKAQTSGLNTYKQKY
jgi:penicillin-binding protein 1A